MIRINKRGSGQPFTLLLFCLFAVCACLMIALSAQAYQKIQKEQQLHFETMNVFSYINNKIKENDLADSIEVMNIEGIDVLRLSNIEGDFVTATYIYSMDGMLYEIYAAADMEVSLDDGRALIECGSVSFEKIERKVIVRYETMSHEYETMIKYLRAGG